MKKLITLIAILSICSLTYAQPSIRTGGYGRGYLDRRYVEVSGDTMTGNLTVDAQVYINNTSVTLHSLTSKSGGANNIYIENTGGTDVQTDWAGTGGNEGTFEWQSGSDTFLYRDDVYMASNEKFGFNDFQTYINSSTDGQLDVDADVEVEITAPTLDINASTAISINQAITSSVASSGILIDSLRTFDAFAFASGLGIDTTGLRFNIVTGDYEFLYINAVQMNLDAASGALTTASTITSGLDLVAARDLRLGNDDSDDPAAYFLGLNSDGRIRYDENQSLIVVELSNGASGVDLIVKDRLGCGDGHTLNPGAIFHVNDSDPITLLESTDANEGPRIQFAHDASIYYTIGSGRSAGKDDDGLRIATGTDAETDANIIISFDSNKTVHIPNLLNVSDDVTCATEVNARGFRYNQELHGSGNAFMAPIDSGNGWHQYWYDVGQTWLVYSTDGTSDNGNDLNIPVLPASGMYIGYGRAASDLIYLSTLGTECNIQGDGDVVLRNLQLGNGGNVDYTHTWDGGSSDRVETFYEDEQILSYDSCTSFSGTALRTRNISSNYTATAKDNVIICSQDVTVSLPSLVVNTTPRGMQLYVKNAVDDNGIVTVDANGSQLIEGELTQEVYPGDCLEITNNGVSWYII